MAPPARSVEFGSRPPDAGLNILAFIGLFFLLPETKQRTLEELDSVFAVPTDQFIKHNLTQEVRFAWVLNSR